MKRLILIAGMLAMAATHPAQAQMSLPDNFQKTCTVTATEFKGWFGGVAPSADTPAMPAKSDTFTQDNPNNGSGPSVCDFYKWGSQMFLWLTSPRDKGLVLDGPSIFDVSPAVNNVRTLISHTDDAAYTLGIRTSKSDAEEIGEIGQAFSEGVLLSNRHSPGSGHPALVYYGVHVNDVYGYFLTGQKSSVFKGPDFPHNPADLAEVVKYAKDRFNADLPNARALVMELKTSWVAADAVPDKRDYVTIMAEVPVFTPAKDNLSWTPNGTSVLELALVGMHVVGTVQDHPEFVWATFEHISNAPDASYWYDTTADAAAEWPYDSSGEFLFMTSGTKSFAQNTMCAQADGSTIVYSPASKQDSAPACTGGIVPSNTIREYPWGSKPQNETAIRENNTMLLSINDSVRTRLASADPRRFYVQTGGVWTNAGSDGTGPIPNQKKKDTTGDMRGSMDLSNATMETYTMGGNCFGCHSITYEAPPKGPLNSFQPFQLSHIFSQIEGLK